MTAACPWCGKHPGVNLAGRFVTHRENGKGTAICEGSGEPADDGAQA